ncbi:unnamed protein product [Somion occarium]|uniref:Serine hydroxymethyltransferase-like domain-containing protein n=1 Tax=Somion occarium TaxID=3059160 RepID=A0ABP1E1U5_9APHY
MTLCYTTTKVVIQHPREKGVHLTGILEHLVTPPSPDRNLETGRERKLALIVHGVLGHKDYLYQKRLARRLPFHSFRFDFRGNHESSGESGSIWTDVADLQLVYDYVTRKLGYAIDLIVAHSRGAITSFIWMCTSADAVNVGGFINVSGRCRMKKLYDIMDDEQRAMLANQGFYYMNGIVAGKETWRRFQWGVNVQPYSGSTANFAALTALLHPQDRLMGLGLPDGGHLVHGYYTAKKKMTASSIYFQSLPYGIDPATQLIDHNGIKSSAKIYKPRLIICDIAHIGGLVAAGEQANPFEYCDVVTTTSHETLRGPRAGLIFFKKTGEKAKDLEKRVNDAVFPACRGGPHNNAIAGIATALLQASQPTWKAYAKQVIANAKTLGEELVATSSRRRVLTTILSSGISGPSVSPVANSRSFATLLASQSTKTLFLVTLSLKSPVVSVSIVADFLHRAVQFALVLQKEAGSKLLKDFVRVATVEQEGKEGAQMVKQLGREVREFARRWPLPGVDVSTLQRPAGIEEDE